MTTQRCGWCSSDPLYINYHDHEWGKPLHDEKQLFAMLCLEGQQAGLSWITVLKKREHYHRQFFQYSIEQIAALSDTDLAEKVQDIGLIRHIGKPVPYTHLRAHEAPERIVCRLLLEKKKRTY